jgi:hypothetical protein
MWSDRRASKRLQIALWCNVAVAGGAPLGRMLTENVSRYGILLHWRRETAEGLPRVGDLLTVEIELPPYAGLERKCIFCQTEVVRVEGVEPDAPLVAVKVSRMRFRSMEARAEGPARTPVTAWLT